jgi:exodeoxyribonuclease-3
MRIATWNVNSVKQRLDCATAWLAERSPDVVCLQETKCVDDAFPREAFEGLGYNVAIHGQKGFNGVAILSKAPFDEVTARLPGDNGDEQARFLEAVISTEGGVVRIASIYLPNGNPPDTDKYSYKIKWMDRLIDYARERMALEEPLILAGDYNVIPTVADARNPSACERRAIPAADAGALSFAGQSRLHRRGARRQRQRRALHVLGLSSRRLAEEQRHPHRSRADVAASDRQIRQRHHR